MLWYGVIVFVFVFIYFYKKIRRILTETLSQWIPSIKVVQGQGFKRATFTISLPYTDALLAFYLVQKHGMPVISHYLRSLPMEDVVYEVDLTLFKLYTTGDASITAKILNSSDPGHLSRPKMIEMLSYIPKKGLLAAPYELWNEQRKICSRAFTFRCMQSYTETINQQSKQLTQAIRTMAMINGGLIEASQLEDLFKNIILKITLEFIIGSSVEISEKEAIDFSKDLYEFKEISLYRLFHLECYFPLVWRLHPKHRRGVILEKRMSAFAKKVIEHYKMKTKKDPQNDGDDADLGKRCLVEEMIKYGATPEEIYDEIATFLVAGNDTISAALDIVLHHLACHPEYQSRCRDEIDDLLGPYSSIDTDMDKNIDMDQLSKLDFLDRFFSESLRITPTIPTTARELNSPLKINDELTLQKGHMFAIFPWAIHRNPKYYPDPEVFDPDRFLPEEVEKRGPGTFIPFSAGYRNCIGRRLAMLELKTLIAWILRNFELSTEDGLHDVKLNFEFVVKPDRPFKTVFHIRNYCKK